MADDAGAGGRFVRGGGDHGQEGLVDGDTVLEVGEHELQLGEVEEVAVDGGDDVILGDQLIGGRLVVIDRGGGGLGARELELVWRDGWHNVLADRREPGVCSNEDILPLGAIAVASTSMEASTKPAANTPRMLTVVLVRSDGKPLIRFKLGRTSGTKGANVNGFNQKPSSSALDKLRRGNKTKNQEQGFGEIRSPTTCSSRPPFQGLTDVVQVRANDRRRAAMS